VPYGIYDLTADAGWVSVGCDGDTAAFAVATLRRWWQGQGRGRYPQATRLLITADAGGANGYRVRAWKQGLAGFAHATGLEVMVCHFPPGTSKWNTIEHQLSSRISSNWRGRPLTSHEVVVNTIGATTTRTGLTVHAEYDPGSYPTGITVSDEAMAALPLVAHDWHGTWNYTLRPEPPKPPPLPRYQDRTQPKDRAPDWLHHPTLTGMGYGAFTGLLGNVEQYLLDHPPISLHHKRARHRILRRGPLSLSDRLLVTVLRLRWKTQLRALTLLPGAPANAVGDAVLEMTPILDALGNRPRPAPITAPTQADLANLIGRNPTKNTK
jgi:hypothetical protein